jgi:glycosyltransferase involved in cell wall biosynthesis
MERPNKGNCKVKRYLFVCPRFHTNQIALIEQLQQQGIEVIILTQYQTELENHKNVQLIQTRQAVFSKMLIKAIEKLSGKTSEKLIYRFFFSTHREIRNYVETIAPDVVIVRDQLMNSVAWAMALRKRHDVLVVDYNQRPLFYQSDNTLKSRFFQFRNRFIPKYHYTPVYKREFEGSIKLEKAKHTVFIPFIVNCNNIVKETSTKIRILDVGKYRPYKNHKLLVNAFSKLSDKERYHVTIVGQKFNEVEKKYFAELEAMIKDMNLENYFSLVCNVPNEKMDAYYLTNDILVLSSSHELASYAILEAMSYKLAVISSNDNGTAWYVLQSKAGSLFKTKDSDSLASAIQQIGSSDYVAMGERGYHFVKEKCNIEAFNQGIKTLYTAK